MNAISRAALLAVTVMSANAAQAQSLTLEEAIEQSVSSSPQGAATAARIEGLNAARAAADTKPAATIEGSIENIGTSGFNEFQIDGTYNQRLERGGKRLARRSGGLGSAPPVAAAACGARADLVQRVDPQLHPRQLPAPHQPPGR